jgi:glycerol-3-phosphate dehydrogenase
MQGVTGAAYWEDGCMSSGERLALAFAQSANESGAVVLGRVTAESILSSNNRIKGILAKDLVDGDNLELFAKVVLDCRGVGINASPSIISGSDLGIEFVKAVNVVIRDRGIKSAIGAPVRGANGDPVGGRLIFARPGNEETIIGTWYFEGDPDNSSLTPRQSDEILEAINSAFPGWQVTPDEIVDVQVGFLPRKKTSGSELLPIEHPMIIEATSLNGVAGLWHIQTEKWTTVRALAERVISMVSSKEGIRVAPSATHEISLCGGENLTLTDAQSRLVSTLSESQSSRLLSQYGGRVPKVLDYVLREPGLAGTVDSTPGILKAEIPYVLDNEMVRTIEDLKNRLLQDRIRRSGSGMDANLTEIVRTFRNRGHQGENRDSVFAGRQ